MGIEDVGRTSLSIVVRLLGLFLLLAGLWVAMQVLMEALDLYHEPQNIERFARAIEQGSNIDKSLSSIRESAMSSTKVPDEEQEAGAVAPPPAKKPVATPTGNNVRISYFLAWIIVLMLMMLIASISLRAIKTGGELVLYDMQIKQFAKMLVRESSKARNT